MGDSRCNFKIIIIINNTTIQPYRYNTCYYIIIIVVIVPGINIKCVCVCARHGFTDFPARLENSETNPTGSKDRSRRNNSNNHAFPVENPKTVSDPVSENNRRLVCSTQPHAGTWYTCLRTPTCLAVLRVRVYYNMIFLRVCAYYYFTSITLSLTHTHTHTTFPEYY